MSEGEDKTPEQVSDEDYKVAPTSADEQYLKKAGGKKAKATGENYQLPDEKVKE